jgi:DNA adenine methylase
MAKHCNCPKDTIHDIHKKDQCLCVKPKTKLNPLICWVGSKNKMADAIIKKIPEHNTYVEPFAGRASMFFNKELAKKNVINDKNENLIMFYKKMKETNPKELEKCTFPDKQEWEKLNEKKEGKLSDCQFWKHVVASYGCAGGNYYKKDDQSAKRIGNGNTRIINNLVHYQNKLSNAKLTSQDYKTVIKKYDGKDTVFYVDPPYPKTFQYGQPKIKPEDVAESLKAIKGKAIISYNDIPEVRNAFKKKDGWKTHTITATYAITTASLGTHMKKKELLITNY